MLDRLRLLPTVMICAGLLLGLKVVHLVAGVEEFTAISPARAEGESKANPDGGKATDEAGTAKAKAELAAQTKQLNDPKVSAGEVQVLESLSARRDELDKRAKDLDLREQLLKAAEKRVEDRVTELKQIEGQIKQQIADNDKRNDEKLAGVVKMYETMKPKDAARIFERLDMGVLLDVARRMEPRKMSAVLAAMDPVTAQELTVELATGDKLPGEGNDGEIDPKAGGANAAPAAPSAQDPAKAPAAPQAAVPAAPQASGQPG